MDWLAHATDSLLPSLAAFPPAKAGLRDSSAASIPATDGFIPATEGLKDSLAGLVPDLAGLTPSHFAYPLFRPSTSHLTC